MRTVPVVLYISEGYEGLSNKDVMDDIADVLDHAGWKIGFELVDVIEEAGSFKDIDIPKLIEAWKSGLPKKSDLREEYLNDGQDLEDEE